MFREGLQIVVSPLDWHSTPSPIYLDKEGDEMAPKHCPSIAQLGTWITLCAEAGLHSWEERLQYLSPSV